MPPLPNRSGEQIKEERASKASIGSHVTLIADFINAIGPEEKCQPDGLMLGQSGKDFTHCEFFRP
jgi:hypothetical protein